MPETRSREIDSPGPYTTTSIERIMVLAGVIERVVERQVTAEVERQRSEREPQARPDNDVAGVATIDVTSDATVAALMRKMRTLARQEQFRLGRLP